MDRNKDLPTDWPARRPAVDASRLLDSGNFDGVQVRHFAPPRRHIAGLRMPMPFEPGAAAPAPAEACSELLADPPRRAPLRTATVIVAGVVGLLLVLAMVAFVARA